LSMSKAALSFSRPVSDFVTVSICVD